MKLSLVLFAAGAAVVDAWVPPGATGLAQCGQICLGNMADIAMKQWNCTNGDAKCDCSNPEYFNGVRDCSNQSCQKRSDAAAAIAFANSYCQSAGVAPPSSSAAPPGTAASAPISNAGAGSSQAIATTTIVPGSIAVAAPSGSDIASVANPQGLISTVTVVDTVTSPLLATITQTYTTTGATTTVEGGQPPVPTSAPAASSMPSLSSSSPTVSLTTITSTLPGSSSPGGLTSIITSLPGSLTTLTSSLPGTSVPGDVTTFTSTISSSGPEGSSPDSSSSGDSLSTTTSADFSSSSPESSADRPAESSFTTFTSTYAGGVAPVMTARPVLGAAGILAMALL